MTLFLDLIRIRGLAEKYLELENPALFDRECSVEKEEGMRPQVLLIRIVLGVIFGVLLSRFFFPASGNWLILLIAGLLVFFAYVFELLHKKDDL